MSEHYILDGHETIPVDMLTWAMWFKSNSDARRVANEEVGHARVSTVFLGLDHSFGSGQPMIFETLVFGGPHDGDMERCTTWAEAEAQHAMMVKKISASEPPTARNCAENA